MTHHQLPLFAPSQPAPTSIEAAEEIQASAESLRAYVLAYIRSQGPRGATDEEIAIALSMNPSTARPRRIELTQRGAVVDSGSTRLTRSGRKAVVWIRKAVA